LAGMVEPWLYGVGTDGRADEGYYTEC
jgi:hypothetical protein